MWTGLLLGSQTTDTLTTAIDRARGTIETMPVSARILDVGGIALFWSFKLLIVATVAVALLTAAHLVREGHRVSRITFQLCLIGVQAATICLAFTSLSNLALLTSIQS